MSKLADQWIDLFRAGDYTSKDKGKFTEQDLQQIVDNYDPAHHEAPVTVGHPEGKSPAFAWMQQLRRVGDVLQGKLKDVYPAFEDAVQQKLYKKRSVGLVKDDAKGWMLHHLAFLGGMAPEVKGLADLKYAEPDSTAVEIEFSEETEMAEVQDVQIDNALTRFFAKFASKPGAAEPKGYTEEEVKAFAAAAAKEAIKDVETRLEAQAAEFAEAKKRSESAASKTRATEAVDKLKASGKWIPAFAAMGLPQIFEELAKSDATIEFGEADAATKAVPKVAPLDLAVAFFEKLGKIVPGGKLFNESTDTRAAKPGAGVNETATVKADPNSTLLDEKVRQLMSEKKIEYGAALTQVISDNPELAKPGGASAGAV